jgi:hypothetical protein
MIQSACREDLSNLHITSRGSTTLLSESVVIGIASASKGISMLTTNTSLVLIDLCLVTREKELSVMQSRRNYLEKRYSQNRAVQAAIKARCISERATQLPKKQLLRQHDNTERKSALHNLPSSLPSSLA